MRLFVFGCGYSASAFVERLPRESVAGVTTRSEAKASGFAAKGLTPYLFDGEGPGEGIAAALARATHLLVSIAPGAAGDPVLRQHRDAIARGCPALEWIGYLSTVGVYGDHGGAWVDEETPLAPVSARSRERVEAERLWTVVAEARGVPLAILRLSGIYGPGRNAIVNLAEGKARRLVKPDQVFNRIHVADIAGSLALLAEQRTGGVFNVTDDEPAPPQDVVEHAARLVGAAIPPAIDFDTAELSPMARSFYGENKRVSNARLKRLGYSFEYPTYREALEALKSEWPS
ncbi:NAD(P)-dependent oxidoreductase [Aureimonas sp. Leaf454]|uniref:SDR family NAD(P)-dependent oxidoreductase n=1 Tax=Aureimonas sp. Leaf454 TaxID=1736381 RepID=UPI0006F9E0ED|nr:SDR family NAD(P)-dependent oxidoreductase [Aureimonas sp. Leaf454]KQT43196.1 NAD(P)-dependent oxidoreductase [Aureimonas sp. Leaf454]